MAALSSSPELVGRTEELALLEAALGRAAGGHPSAVVIGGEGGVGKTRLVSELAEQARRRGATVLVGGCIELGDGGLPYAPVVDALRPVLRHRRAEDDAAVGSICAELGLLLPGLGEVTTGSAVGAGPRARARVLELVVSLLDQLSRRSPVVLVLEDLQWADAATRDLLAFVVGHLGDQPTLVVATYRSDALAPGHPLRSLLQELRRNRRAQLVELPRLSREEVAAQVAGILGLPPRTELADVIAARSDGNPFFVEELLAAAVEGQELQVPASLRHILLAGIEDLPASAQGVLRLLAVGGVRVSHRLLAAAAAGLAADDLSTALRVCVDRQAVVVDRPGDVYRFRQPLLREVVYDELLPGERARLHAAYGAALAADPRLAPRWAVAEAARHWFEAGDVDRALPAAVEAAEAAEAAYRFADAHDHYERALEVWDEAVDPAASTGVDRVALVVRAAEVATRAGRHRRATDLIEEALAGEAGARHEGLLWERLGSSLLAA
ncbi:MAG TPA: AAA family ATPase, partial [Acidimicrobiales bacterium]|nr:AAA family ATPase [Acidimicrobiales bacterium]